VPTVIGFDETKRFRISCKQCAAIIEYVPSETFEKDYGHDYLGDYSTGRFLKCPNCSHDIFVR
jgi:hypothetical protein